MILGRVTGDIHATVKNPHLVGCKILIVQPLDTDLSPKGSSLLAVDRVDAGIDDVVLVNKEGGSARIIFENEEIPLQAVIVAVVDDLHVSGE
ncbi:EutN/CcmL family microcompartment protein [bacterium]|nr:EutN/CcmL family microcompartment protein [bacterium]MBU1650913.1 EutN/CcmL family microcompartment protein [bacterium]MBU1880614.1 EutN/CcmL family microcompartment protein [bacterium]